MRLGHLAPIGHPIDVRAVILTAEGFEDLEVLVPYLRLLEAGAQVDVAAPTTGDIVGRHGYAVMPDLPIDDVEADAYDVLLIPGGSAGGAPAIVRDARHAQEVARSFMGAGKPVAAICHGAWLLASADVVRGRRLTSYPRDGVPEDIRAAGGIWQDAAVVVDGALVTSRWPADLPAFLAELMPRVGALSLQRRSGQWPGR